ncbi:LysE family translocator [Isoptericola sp. NPDC057191]|uniref:LysE family translocator n=1 Tax=Isoptericola sp. NPDC057191 TaxID=3346041 RepID=UPI00363B9D47
MDLSAVLQFWVVAALLALTPGADWAYAIAAGLRARSVVPSVLGMVCGYVLVVGVVALGVGTVVTRYPAVLTVLTVTGAAYLVYLGARTLRSTVGRVGVSERPLGDRPLAQFLRGAGVSAINPKGLLLLLALLPQFTSATGWPSSVQLLVLGGLHVLDVAVVYSVVAVLARRVLSARPRAGAVVTKVAGVVMVVLGLALLIEKVWA